MATASAMPTPETLGEVFVTLGAKGTSELTDSFREAWRDKSWSTVFA